MSNYVRYNLKQCEETSGYIPPPGKLQVIGAIIMIAGKKLYVGTGQLYYQVTLAIVREPS